MKGAGAEQNGEEGMSLEEIGNYKQDGEITRNPVQQLLFKMNVTICNLNFELYPSNTKSGTLRLCTLRLKIQFIYTLV